jgi:hypothetical protein
MVSYVRPDGPKENDRAVRGRRDQLPIIDAIDHALEILVGLGCALVGIGVLYQAIGRLDLVAIALGAVLWLCGAWLVAMGLGR